jgi:hypothetical protein
VKLHKHSNHGAGKSSNFLKNGQDLRSRIRAGNFKFLMKFLYENIQNIQAAGISVRAAFCLFELRFP